MIAVLLLLAALSNASEPANGELRISLSRRFPACRGTIEHMYAGDEYSFFHRYRMSAGCWRFVLLLDKARGEDWVDTVAGGIQHISRGTFPTSISAGWLRAQFGSGLVMSGSENWSSAEELSMYKPFVIRNRLEPTSSAWSCREEPLTGVGAQLEFSEFSLALLAAISWKDSTTGGIHRTPSEVLGRRSIRETLGALRIVRGRWGLTIACAGQDIPDGYHWFRGGVDWNLEFPDVKVRGESACGSDSSGVEVAFWTSLSQEFESFRHTLSLIRNPQVFPSNRTSPPIDRAADPGICYGMRYRLIPGGILRAGAGAYHNSNQWLIIGSVQAEYRTPWRMEIITGIRSRKDESRTSIRGWVGGTWKPLQDFRLSTKVQITSWHDTENDSSETGSGIELKLRYFPREWISIALGGAAFSTDGYNSRVYAGRSALPGEFGSTALWDRGFLLHGQISAEIIDELFLRISFSHIMKDNTQNLGAGWEETAGNERTEVTIQLDCSFPR